MEKAYELRALMAEDIFVMLKIINKIGLKEIRECFNTAEVRKAVTAAVNGGEEADVSAVGIHVAFELANLIAAHLPDCKAEIYQFLSSLSGIPKKDMAELPFNTFVDMLMDVFKKEEFKDFFQRLVGSSK